MSKTLFVMGVVIIIIGLGGDLLGLETAVLPAHLGAFFWMLMLLVLITALFQGFALIGISKLLERPHGQRD